MTTPRAYVVAMFVVALTAAAFDWRTGRIPNPLTLGAILVAVPGHAYLATPGHVWDGVESSLIGAAICAAPFVLGWRMGWIAGGDAKLVAALGALGGISLGLEAIFLGLFFSGAFVFVRLCWQGVFFKTVVNGFAVAATRTVIRGKAVAPRPEFTSTLRFGPFALAGAALSLVLHGGLL